MKKPVVLSFVYALIVSIIVALIRGYGEVVSGLNVSLVAGAVLYFILTVVLLVSYREKAKTENILLAIITGAVLLILPLHIIYFKATLVSLQDTVFELMGIGAGYLFFRFKKTIWKAVITVLFLALVMWMGLWGSRAYYHLLAFGTFNGREIISTEDIDLKLVNGEGEIVSLSELSGDYVVLDFWSSGCGVCLEKMPVWQKMYDEHRDDSRIGIYTVHCYYEKWDETPATGAEILGKKGYTMPMLATDIEDYNHIRFGVTRFPTVIVLDESRTIVFRGNTDAAERYIGKLMRD